VDEPNRYRIEEVELLSATASGDDESRVLENLEMLHDAEARHHETLLERTQRLAVLAEEFIEQLAPSRIRQCPEDLVHTVKIGD
jgi:hypothetical protein